MTMLTIDFYFEFASPYSYIAAKRIAAIAAKYNGAVRWLPVDISKIWLRHDLIESYGRVRALKRNFIRKDSRMVAESHGIALAERGQRLADAKLAKLAVHYLNARNYDVGAAFCMVVWDRFFGQGIDISTEDQLFQAGHEYISMNELEMVCEDKAANAALDQANVAAHASGCFGVPWFVIDGEVFFGQDRLELIGWWLQRRGQALSLGQ
jgi:2-hydroxychromene-2-carboxylate isomerase